LQIGGGIPGWPAWLLPPTRQLERGPQGFAEAGEVEKVEAEEVEAEKV
jgi:hypothetical protein